MKQYGELQQMSQRWRHFNNNSYRRQHDISPIDQVTVRSFDVQMRAKNRSRNNTGHMLSSKVV